MERIRRFINGLKYSLHYSMARELETDARFDQVVEIAKRLEQVRKLEREERKAKRPRSSGGFNSASSGVSHSSYNARPAQSSFSAPPAHSSYRSPFAQASTGSSSVFQGQQPYMRVCYECGDLIHLKRDCPILLSRVPQQSSQPMISAPTAKPPAQLAYGRAQSARGHPRGRGRSSGGQAHFYAFPSRTEAVASNTVITIPVVRDFLDVFPADLPGMPPDWDIDFGIDLVLGTLLISISSYLMAPIELKELK
ncbi:uncharacterized protein [Nicotiana tomentosiformis]|uniref:uncharacterized protein n=1 Tax=Nicotiana tomentosiformis TaxID=4098 RepID=UPI00388C972A